MAALTTQASIDGAVTFQAATGGGDTIESGTSAGGWSSAVLLVANVGATATTITVGGVAKGPFTSQIAVIPVYGIYRGRRVAITYSQVTGVTVAAVSDSPALTNVTFGL